MVPPYGRIVYYYTNPTWIPSAIKNAQSNCLTGVRKQNRIDILDWTLEIKEVSLILNLDMEEISYMGTKNKTTMRSPQRRMSTDIFYKSNNSLGTPKTLSIIRTD